MTEEELTKAEIEIIIFCMDYWKRTHEYYSKPFQENFLKAKEKLQRRLTKND